MATSQNKFALDWVNSELVETLDGARKALEAYAESDTDRTRLRTCLTALHQVHGTLVMLELDGVTLLADHLERLSQSLHNGDIDNEEPALNLLMQGIVQLPGELSELRGGGRDERDKVIGLVNDIRHELGEVKLDTESHGGPVLVTGLADEAGLEAFQRIDGQGKARRLRAAYQQVLLSLLKGADKPPALATLCKVAAGLVRICDGLPASGLWRAFELYLRGLSEAPDQFDGDAIKLMRRVDAELRQLAQEGADSLKRPVSLDLVRMILDAASSFDCDLNEVADVAAAVDQTSGVEVVTASGKEALASAAAALREELALVKDQLDILVRGDVVEVQRLSDLISPLKQIANTLSLLGFESSRAVVIEQLDTLATLADSDTIEVADLIPTASALVQVDENLASLQSKPAGKDTELERLADDAQITVVSEARAAIDTVKTQIVAFVSAEWDVAHLESAGSTLAEVGGALEMVPLPRAAELLARCRRYIEDELAGGRVPDWNELNDLADAIGGIDYYLERLAERTAANGDDVLDLVDASLGRLPMGAGAQRSAAQSDAVASAETGDTFARDRIETPAESGTEFELVIDDDALEAATPATVSDDESGESENDTLALEADDTVAEVSAPDGLSPPHDADIPPGEQQRAEDVARDAADTLDAEPEIELTLPPSDEAGTTTARGADVSVSSTSDAGADIDPAADEEPDAFESADAENAVAASDHGAGHDDAAGLESARGLDDAAAAASAAEAFEFDEVLEDVAGELDVPAAGEAAETAAEVGADQHADADAGSSWAVVADVERVPANAAQPDPEILEIFLEEVGEVTDTIDEQLALWRADPENESALAEIRRAFHTLKGSGRIVGANVIGEMAWSVENMLNRLLDNTVAYQHEYGDVVERAHAALPCLRDAFEAGEPGDLIEVSIIMEAADVLASGGTLTAGDDASEAAHEADADSVPADDHPIFFAETSEHAATVRAALDATPVALTDDLLRALHTLSGSAAMAGLGEIVALVRPAYHMAQSWREHRGAEALSDRCVAVLAQVVEHLELMVAQPDVAATQDYASIVAVETQAIIDSLEGEVAQSDVLASPAVERLFAVPEFLDRWRQGGIDLQQADEIAFALDEVGTLARERGVAPLTDLAEALAHTHRALVDSTLGDAPYRTLSDAHERLLRCLDAVAVQQTPEDSGLVLVELNALVDSAAAPAADAGEPDDIDALIGVRAPDEDFSDIFVDEQANAGGDEFIDLAELGVDDVASSENIPEVHATAAPAETAPPADAHETAAPTAAASEGDDVDDEIIQVFFEEADEILEEVEESIQDWLGERSNRLYLENLLRALHTLKGGARLAGLSELGDQAHVFESFLIEVQNSDDIPESEFFEDLQNRYDDLVAMVSRLKRGDQREKRATEAAEAEADMPPVATVLEAAEPEADDAQSTIVPFAGPPMEQMTARDNEVVGADDTTRAPDASRAGQEMVRVGAGLLETLVNLAGESSIVRARIEQGMSDFTGALDEMETTIERLREQLRRLEIETEAQVLFRHERSDGPDYDHFDPLEMDRYSQLQQLSRSLSESASDMLDLKETLLLKARESETLLLQQARLNTEMQEGLMRTRMVPFNRLLPRLRRIVRQVARELGKEVEFHAYNAEGELDRNLLERMVPPLEHMLRNAVDHGIESPELRRGFGKPPGGRIDLRLSREGGDVVIEINDDGAGIDVESVRAKALERELMAPDANLSDEEITQFVLAAGFSTAKSVTQISGRGVGMDVVNSEVKQLGGSIGILSRPGKGTRFTVRLPFTVSVNRALMVSVGEDLYAIPLNTIEGIVLVSGRDLARLNGDGSATFEYAGIPYRVQYLGRYLGRESAAVADDGTVPMVLVRAGEQAVAVHVDGVQGSREIVVKSLGPQFAGVGGISGATILGDGNVVVILDLLGLIRNRGIDGSIVQRPTPVAGKARCVMVVDDSVTVRKVTSRLLERQGMDVIVAKDGVEAVALLQERKPDIMLLDIEMPRMDGFEVARQVRHDDRLGALPIVMITSRTGDKHKEHAAELGVNKFLGKPFQENELLATIDDLVS